MVVTTTMTTMTTLKIQSDYDDDSDVVAVGEDSQ
jgi:hypothetical protein